jgi:hypothetical protein
MATAMGKPVKRCAESVARMSHQITLTVPWLLSGGLKGLRWLQSQSQRPAKKQDQA